jgi:hypothetical protein
MKASRCFYNDDGVLIPGILVTCLWQSVFYPTTTKCGWSEQKITYANKHLIQKG